MLDYNFLLMWKEIVSRKVLIAGMIFSISLCLFALIFQVFISPFIIIENEDRIRVVITPISEELKTQAAQVNVEAQSVSTPTPIIPGVFAPGMIIVISGTQGEGLNVRQEPGTDRTVVYLALEGETYTITNGPEIKDGLIWWFIDQTEEGIKSGWAVQDYFSPLGQ
jgi:hypothetical protein